MKAAVVTALGDPETLVLQDVPDPVAGAGEILVKVLYSGINYAETLARRGMVPVPPPPFVVGLEVVGTVAALGEGVEGFEVGRPVCAFSRSGHAEYAVVSALLAAPLDLPGHEVAADRAIGVPCTGVTAHQLLTLMGRLSEGETVFVQGAAGGVGTMLGQQAKALGAGKVIGSVGSETKIGFARDHGYDDVILRDGFVESLKASTGGHGVDLFLEGISGANLASPADFLAPLGRAVFFGDANFTSDTEVGVSPLRSTSLTLSGYSLGGLCATRPQRWRPSALTVLGMIARGEVRETGVTLLHPSEAGRAHALLESRQSQGKLGLDWSAL